MEWRVHSDDGEDWNRCGKLSEGIISISTAAIKLAQLIVTRGENSLSQINPLTPFRTSPITLKERKTRFHLTYSKFCPFHLDVGGKKLHGPNFAHE
jgi:hypothetical protein